MGNQYIFFLIPILHSFFLNIFLMNVYQIYFPSNRNHSLRTKTDMKPKTFSIYNATFVHTKVYLNCIFKSFTYSSKKMQALLVFRLFFCTCIQLIFMFLQIKSNLFPDCMTPNFIACSSFHVFPTAYLICEFNLKRSPPDKLLLKLFTDACKRSLQRIYKSVTGEVI